MNRAKRQIYFPMLFFKLKFLLGRPKALPFFIRDYLYRSIPKSRQNVIVSYPKSGRTWLEQLLIQVAVRSYGVRECGGEHFQDLTRLHHQAPYVLLTHACSSWEDLRIFDENEILQVDNERQAGKKTVFLYRDPRDVLVSSYYHLRHRNGIRRLSRADMIDHPVVGLHKILRFMNRWLEYVQTHDHCIMVSYENLKADPVATLASVCELFGFHAGDNALNEAIDACSFAKMQLKEKEKTAKSPRLQMTNDQEPHSRKVRRGRVGDHRAFFSVNELERMNRIITAELDPIYLCHPDGLR
ncbi:MAG: sulfotransferase domain-containing protein [Desulfobacterales bacterium]|nr:sulfotransferase domain-containing protein [Desulfobacterales bacterium]